MSDKIDCETLRGNLNCEVASAFYLDLRLRKAQANRDKRLRGEPFG